MSGFGCDELPYSVAIPFLSLNALCVLANMTQIFFVFRHFLCRKSAPDGNDGFNHKLGLVSTVAMILLLITSILIFCSLLVFQLCPSNSTNISLYRRLTLAAEIFTLSAYVSINASFFYRIVLAFENSIVDIKNKNSKLHKCISIIITVESILLTMYAAAAIVWLQASIKIQKIFFFVCYIMVVVVVLVHIILVIFLVKFFVKQLKYMFAFFASANVNHNSNDGINKVTRKLLNTATKTYVSYVFTIISTAILVLVLLLISLSLSSFEISVNNGNSEVIYTILICSHFTIMNIDNVINTLCLSLQWPFSSKLYVFFCKKFHLIIMSKFSNQFKNASVDVCMTRNLTME